MSLTMGTGPFGPARTGAFNFAPPDRAVFVEPFPRRVRGIKDGKAVVDSDRVKLVHETNHLARYSFPVEDVRVDARPDPHVEGHVVVDWRDMDAWYEEDEQVFGHVKDPYHRIEVVSTSRSIRVSVEGVVLAETTRAKGLYETGLPIRWYLPPEDVRVDLLQPSDTRTTCAYKGHATHWSARIGDRVVPDIGWSYEDPWRDAMDVRGYIAFYNERVDLDMDGERQERPKTPWSR
jgi:uncharacterized protein (DUF427 family)